ncbi:MAG: hypothetical protein R3B47_05505 [Bacteroidia bacterium]
MNSKQINYRGGLLIFSVPGHWEEEYGEEEGGVFYEDRPDSGTLHVNVISMKSPHSVSKDDANKILESLGATVEIEQLPNDLALRHFVRKSTEDGNNFVIHFWQIAQTLKPDRVRLAIFSFTFLEKDEKKKETLSVLDFLNNAIRNVRFANR